MSNFKILDLVPMTVSHYLHPRFFFPLKARPYKVTSIKITWVWLANVTIPSASNHQTLTSSAGLGEIVNAGQAWPCNLHPYLTTCKARPEQTASCCTNSWPRDRNASNKQSIMILGKLGQDCPINASQNRASANIIYFNFLGTKACGPAIGYWYRICETIEASSLLCTNVASSLLRFRPSIDY